MCLDRVAEKNIANPGKVRQGWKVFSRERRARGRHALYFPCCNLPGRTTGLAPQGRWLKSHQGRIGGGYSNGFHIFTRKRNAEMWGSFVGEKKVVKVKYKSVVAYGTQGKHILRKGVVMLPVHVAREMFVPKGE